MTTSIRRKLQDRMDVAEFRWKVGTGWDWPVRRRLAWILFGGMRAITNGKRVAPQMPECELCGEDSSSTSRSMSRSGK